MTEGSERRFVERRSAFVDVDEVEAVPGPSTPDESAIETTPEPAVADESPMASERTAEPAEAGSSQATRLDLEEMARVEIPEPSFYEIVQPLEIQALQFLGELPLTSDGQRGVLPQWAKHVIDLLGILEERTRGNLTPEESQYLEQVLADLRLRYVRASS